MKQVAPEVLSPPELLVLCFWNPLLSQLQFFSKTMEDVYQFSETLGSRC